MNDFNISVIDEYQSDSRTSYPRTDDSVDSHDARPFVDRESPYSADIKSQNTIHSGDNSQSLMSQDTVLEMDVVTVPHIEPHTEPHTEPHREGEISPAVQQHNKSKICSNSVYIVGSFDN